MPASLSFVEEAILGIMGSQILLHLGALSIRLSMGSLDFIAACSMRSCTYYSEYCCCPILSCA